LELLPLDGILEHHLLELGRAGEELIELGDVAAKGSRAE
jgi:hypothetical protein